MHAQHCHIHTSLHSLQESVADTLEQLWISYNFIEKLTGIEKILHLKVLYASNNRIKDWGEIARCASLPLLVDLLIKGNPVRKDEMSDAEYKAEVLKRVPRLKILDGYQCSGDDDEDDED